jgi:hypothetical protein
LIAISAAETELRKTWFSAAAMILRFSSGRRLLSPTSTRKTQVSRSSFMIGLGVAYHQFLVRHDADED